MLPVSSVNPDNGKCTVPHSFSFSDSSCISASSNIFIFHFYLQRSVNAFFEATQKGGVNILTDGDEGELVVNVK
jgi:hypothetical protein